MKQLLVVLTAFFLIGAAFCQESRLMVFDIQAAPTADGEVLVSWKLPQLPEDADSSQAALHLYRSTEPLGGSDSLAELAPLAVLPADSVSYRDTPPENTTVYYTVIVHIADGDTSPLVIPDRNATVAGVTILPESPAAQKVPRETVQEVPNKATGLRNTPLPYLKIYSNHAKNPDVPLNPEREQHIAPIARLEQTDRRTFPTPHIFRQEQEAENAGEDFILKEIIDTHFTAGDYGAAEQSLRDFLSINHSKDATNRGTFYLGETLLYQGKYRQALSCFLVVQDTYPDLTTRWIQAALDAYQLPVME